MGNERSQILGQRDRTVARRAEEISSLGCSRRAEEVSLLGCSLPARERCPEERYGKHEDVRCESTPARHLLDSVPESLVPRTHHAARSSSAGPVSSDRRGFRFDVRPELAKEAPPVGTSAAPSARPEMRGRSASCEPIFSVTPLPLPKLLPPAMPELSQYPQINPMLVQPGPGYEVQRPPPPAPLRFSQGMAPGASSPAAGGSLLAPGPAIPVQADASASPGGSMDRTISHRPQSISDSGFGARQYGVDYSVPSWFQPSGGPLSPMPLRQEVASYANASYKAAPGNCVPKHRIALKRSSLGSRPREPRRRSEQGIPVHTESFGVVCGSPSVSSSSQAASPAAVSDVRSVTRRMNELAAMCRERLANSRRKADDAEEQLHAVEKDLGRIQLELEVARCLIDSGETAPKRRMSNDLVRERDSHAGIVPLAAAPEKAPRQGSLERANNALLDVLKSMQSPRQRAHKMEQLPPRAHRRRDADSACHEEAVQFFVGDLVQGRFGGDWYSVEITGGPDPEGRYDVYFFTDKTVATLSAADLKACPAGDDLDQVYEGLSRADGSLSTIAPPTDAPKAARKSDAKMGKLRDLKLRVPITESKATAKKLLSLVQAFREELTICKANTSRGQCCEVNVEPR